MNYQNALINALYCVFPEQLKTGHSMAIHADVIDAYQVKKGVYFKAVLIGGIVIEGVYSAAHRFTGTVTYRYNGIRTIKSRKMGYSKRPRWTKKVSADRANKAA